MEIKKLKMKNKKGTHVGIILSFVIFVTFLMFISTVIKPASKVEEEKKYSIDLLKNNILNEIEKEVIVVSVINSSVRSDENCLVVNDEYPSLDFGIKNIGGEVIPGARSGSIYSEWAGEPMIKIYYLDGLVPSGDPSTSECATGEIKNIRNVTEIFEKDFKELITNYSSNYSELKNYLEVPNKDEFNIRFDYLNGTIIGEDPSSPKLDIYVKIFQVAYIDKYLNKKLGDLMIYVW